ncbi:MAG: ubiquitinyl hydrolase 1 [Trizodia sp. TS-e1964]|nr:MAG: ubiquitinyl hydrolase 1 [Trizodia sp. TS-e1964]
MEYTKHYIPLESNPAVFTKLIHALGVSDSLAFHDVLSLDDTDFLPLVPRPALALILVFPTSARYEEHKTKEEASRSEYAACGDAEKVMWYKQTINNACGLYGLLHAVSNGDAGNYITPGSHLSRLLARCRPLKPLDRAKVLENDAELEAAYKLAALEGDSEVPENAEDEVDFHYVCFVKSNKDGHIYEMDGDQKGPVDKGPLGVDEDVLGERGLSLVREFVRREDSGDSNFSLLVLAPA